MSAAKAEPPARSTLRRVLEPLELLGRVAELVLCLILHPVLLAASWLWRTVLARPFGRIAGLVSPSSGPGPVEKVAPLTEPAEPERPAREPEPARGVRPRRSVVRVLAAYLLVLATAALVTMLRRVDSALQQMHVEGTSAGSALGFKVSLGNLTGSLGADTAGQRVDATRSGWEAYSNDVAGITALRNPVDVAWSLVWLDLCYVGLYLALGVLLLVILHRLNARTSPAARRTSDAGQQQQRQARMIASAGAALAALVLVDVFEDIELYRAVVRGDELLTVPGGLALGPLASLLKIVLALAVIVPAGLVAAVLVLRQPAIRRALVSLRGLGYGLLALVVLMSLGIGAAQLDDVIRAWDGPRALWAVVACVILAVTIAGAARRLTAVDPENARPDVGRSAQPLVLGTGVVLVLAGQLLNLVGWGWGVSVPGALLIGLWAIGVPFAGLPRWPELRKQPAFGLRAPPVSRAADPDQDEGPATADAERVTIWGDRLARFAGSLVTGLLVLAIARATALDAYVDETPSWKVLGDPVLAAVATAICGAVVAVYRPRRLLTGSRLWTTAWPWATIVALAGGVDLFAESQAISGAQQLGTAAILFGGFTLLFGLTALLVVGTRRGPLTNYALAPALRVVRLRRFPVVMFLVLWIMVVSALDRGGYHDIRRADVRLPGAESPTLAQAWSDFAGSAPSGARPVVLVGAQGGGIRAAVWTSLVMECIFGPGPVGGSGDACAGGSTPPDAGVLAANARKPVPILLASGASGGSVGLAAWTARRTDWLQDGASSPTPKRIEEALSHDFVAPDLARLLLADLPRSFLAWDTADRAEMLERGWEEAWPGEPDAVLRPESRGLSRGLRQLWDVTHQGPAWGSPILALNGVSVEDGCRFVASAVDFSLPVQLPDNPLAGAGSADAYADRPDDAACRGPVRPGGYAASDVLPSTSELVDYLCPTEDVPLSTAAHLSARFPFVSPTGRVARHPCAVNEGLVPMPAVSYDADGGFFDNSGAGTAVDTWRALQPVVAATEQRRGCLVPVFVQIDNSPPAATVATGADARPPELLAPLNAALGEISSREGYARAAAAAAFTRPVSAGGQRVRVGGAEPASLWFRVTLFGQPGPEPPLGWTLAPETVHDMRAQLRAQSNQDQIQAIRNLLTPGALSCAS